MTNKELLIQEFFKNTTTKLTEDDPIIEIIIGFQQVMEGAKQDLINNREDLKEWGAIFTSRFEDDIADVALKNNVRMEILEHEIRDMVETLSQKLNSISASTLAGFDEKSKDLNMLLTKLQINHEQAIDNNFAEHFAKIDERYNQMMALQKQNNAFSQREILCALGGFVFAVLVCIITLLVVV